jgi:hypothetical protein
MLIVRGDAQTLPSQLNKAATGEVWFDPILPKTDNVDTTDFHEAVSEAEYAAANATPR